MQTISEMPYLTAEMPGIGGRIKEAPEDFRVEEIPLYPPCGDGTHVYFRVVKVGVPTPAVIDRIARHMGVAPREIGVAGLKDARGVTSQMMSLEHADADRLAGYRDAQVRIAGTWRHGNKLRPGHLAGNRFVIRIRQAPPERIEQARAILEVLMRRGVPNYFGRQRFGARGDTDKLGRALVGGDMKEFVALYLGRGRDADPPDCRAAREAFDAGDYDAALRHWPRHYSNERRALSAYRRRGKAGAAVAAIDRRMKRLYVSALQSAIFNRVLAGRIDTLDRVEAGDLAVKTDTGGVFSVEDVAAEQARADRFEISPTGPIVGYRGNLADGRPGQMEREALASCGLETEAFRRLGALKAKGARRALRFRIESPTLAAGSDDRGAFLEMAFAARPAATPPSHSARS